MMDSNTVVDVGSRFGSNVVAFNCNIIKYFSGTYENFNMIIVVRKSGLCSMQDPALRGRSLRRGFGVLNVLHLFFLVAVLATGFCEKRQRKH